ncbi:MAG: Asp-tRNA(Asn)/Glu-tRNA(Gln) amidotransferase subunit GatC [Deinococcales bacterium]
MISDQEMEHLKNLARLELPPQESQSLKSDLNRTLAYFEQLNELDTTGIEEMFRPLDLVNIFREDIIIPTLSHDEAMSVAVEHQDGYFKVPRTLDGDT